MILVILEGGYLELILWELEALNIYEYGKWTWGYEGKSGDLGFGPSPMSDLVSRTPGRDGMFQGSG